MKCEVCGYDTDDIFGLRCYECALDQEFERELLRRTKLTIKQLKEAHAAVSGEGRLKCETTS